MDEEDGGKNIKKGNKKVNGDGEKNGEKEDEKYNKRKMATGKRKIERKRGGRRRQLKRRS